MGGATNKAAASRADGAPRVHCSHMRSPISRTPHPLQRALAALGREDYVRRRCSRWRGKEWTAHRRGERQGREAEEWALIARRRGLLLAATHPPPRFASCMPATTLALRHSRRSRARPLPRALDHIERTAKSPTQPPTHHHHPPTLPSNENAAHVILAAYTSHLSFFVSGGAEAGGAVPYFSRKPSTVASYSSGFVLYSPQWYAASHRYSCFGSCAAS